MAYQSQPFAHGSIDLKSNRPTEVFAILTEYWKSCHRSYAVQIVIPAQAAI